MHIRFERTMDDMIAFNEFHYSHSPVVKKISFRYQWGGALFIVIFSNMVGHWIMPEAPPLLMLSVSLVGAVIFASRASAILKKRMNHNTRKMLAEGRNASFLGEQQLELTDIGLTARSDYIETKLAWGAIERIESTPDYTFLYLNSVQAYVISHNKIIEGDCRMLLAEIGRRFQPGQRLERTNP